MVLIRVTGHSIDKDGVSDRPYASYTILVTPESGGSYCVVRRWNDLRRCEEALKNAGLSEVLSKGPAFEAHSWRQSITGTTLDPQFLTERSSQMEEVLQSWMTAFQVRLDPQAMQGPEPLLAFLSRSRPEAGSEASPQPRSKGAPPASDFDTSNKAGGTEAEASEGPLKSWSTLLMWSSLLILPLVAVLVKEGLGTMA
jgi:hypothetical protein